MSRKPASGWGRDEYRAFSRCRCNDLRMRGFLTLDPVLDPFAGGASGTVAYEWTISNGNRGRVYRNSLCIFFDVADGGSPATASTTTSSTPTPSPTERPSRSSLTRAWPVDGVCLDNSGAPTTAARRRPRAGW